MDGYCKKHDCYLTSRDVREKGCKNWRRQRKFGRKVCKYLRRFAGEKEAVG